MTNLQKLYDALRTGDHKAAIKYRYLLTSEGCTQQIANQDFSGCNLSKLPGQFILFENCNLQKVNFAGASFFPVSFKSCDLRGADLTGAGGTAYFWNCDLRGVRYQKAKFGWEYPSLASQFENCKMDDDLSEFLIGQGCPFEIEDRFKVLDFVPCDH